MTVKRFLFRLFREYLPPGVALPVFILVILYTFTIFHTVSAKIDNQRAFWLDDDMMISMGYGRSLAHGYGLVWYPGADRVEGYSNMGWVLIMALVHLLPLRSTLTSLPILILNVLLAGTVLVLTAQLIKRLVPDALYIIPSTLLSLTICSDLAQWTIYGLETPLQMILLLWLILRIIKEADIQVPKAKTFFLIGLLGIIRVDGILLIVLLCLLAFMLNRNKQFVALYWHLAIILPLTNEIFRIGYYSSPFPNTYYLKLTGWNMVDRFRQGVDYVGNFMKAYGIVWILSGVGAYASRNHIARGLWLLGLCLIPYALYTGGDAYPYSRFFAPWLPISFLLAFLTPYWFGWRIPSLRAILFQFLLIGTIAICGGYPFLQEIPTNPDYICVGQTLKSVLRPNSTIAVFAAGTIPYFSELKAYDLLGKNDPLIAYQPARPNINKPGHNKFNYDLSLRLYHPDMIVALGWPPGLELRAEGGRAALDYLDWRDGIFFSSVFQDNYGEMMVVIDGKLPVFIRSDSPERDLLRIEDCKLTEEPYLVTLGIKQVCHLDN